MRADLLAGNPFTLRGDIADPIIYNTINAELCAAVAPCLSAAPWNVTRRPFPIHYGWSKDYK